MENKFLRIIKYALLISLMSIPLYGNDASPSSAPKEMVSTESPSQAPEKVVVQPVMLDEDIQARLVEILQATNWFNDPVVEVENGVVFLSGETKNDRFKEWAGELAHNTQDVVAVVNKIIVLTPPIWDVDFILEELLRHSKNVIRALPEMIFGAVILLLAWLTARLVYKVIPFIFRAKMNPSLLHEVIARAIAFAVFLIGVYFVFELAELTTMALTVISGTGLLGIILGIAFRDLAENFLASILLSLQNPFNTHDLIDLISPVSGYTVTGYVERLTLRVTILVSLDGNYVQIPNATVYKSNIVNHSSNPIHRELFFMKINSSYSVSKAVDISLKILSENEAVLQKPEPLVLVEALEKEAVKLKICYWLDIKKNASEKTKSSIMRLIKQAFQAEGIYPSSREPVGHEKVMLPKILKRHEARKTKSETITKEDRQPDNIQGLSAESHLPEEGDNLLGNSKKSNSSSTKS